ncbi:MAG TPA: CoA transferase [Acidimicrobiales bacterium]|nr:CoA transferase [Acidimicrobiales bacterium]
MVRDLSHVRVLDLSETIGGGYCAKLLSEAGAEVVKGERPGGAPIRRWSCAGPDSVSSGALYAYLHGGHTSVVADEEVLRPLLAAADAVITDLPGPGPDPVDLASDHGSLVVASITPYGLTGPYAGLPASELTAQADGGALAVRGHPSRPPIQAGGQSTEWLAGAYAAAGVLAALRRRGRTGRGGLVDVSWAEVASLSCTLFADITDSVAGRPDLSLRPAARSLETPSVEPTADGYVGFNTNTAQQFSDFLVLIGRTDLLDEDPSWSGLGTRIQRWDDWNAIVHEWTTAHTTAEIVDQAALLRIPVAPITDGETVLAVDHFAERGVFRPDPTGRFKYPRRPWRIDGEEIPALGAVPESGAEPPRWEPRPARVAPTGGDDALPCAGLRVVDLTTWWAGPAASGLLAGLGADVIHVESASHPDGMRMTGGMFAPRDRWWELSGFFLSTNVNKRDVTLELGDPEARRLLLELVAGADVVMENFSPRVIERFDLDWDVIHTVNPTAVMVRMPAFGLDGPWRDRPGFAQTMEQVTGLAWLTGHVDDQPRIQRGPCDPNAGVHAAVATLVALERRDATGIGCFVEVPMVEAALAIAAEPVLEWTAYGNRLSRTGNRDPRACPQGVYPCLGVERWLAISVLDDDQWAGLVGAIGEPVWAKDPELATWEGRRRREDEVDAHLAEWAALQDLDRAVQSLRARGVPAAPAWDPRRVSEHPQFAARGFYEVVDHPVAGRHAVPTQPFRLSGVDRWARRPAPTLGQDNSEVLRSIGVDEAGLARLESAGIVGDRPKGL